VIRVLVADDDADIRYILRVNLEAEGLAVDEAVDGAQALTLAAALGPDVVVLDVMMPGRDGLDVLTALRATAATADLPVIVLSAKANDEDIWQGWRAGADIYLTKPFDVDLVVKHVKALAGGRGGQDA
jgi:DNA-binding response OmpR family regulator